MIRETLPIRTHGIPWGYRQGCRCAPCMIAETRRVRAFYERACDLCGGPTWGKRCKECIRREAKRITLPNGKRVKVRAQPRGLHYEWGCP